MKDKDVGSILVMDDQQMIRDTTSIMLQHLGYDVTACANGEEALQLYKAAMESGTPFAAVILDLLVFCGMGGLETARVIRQYDPHALLIASSGYSSEPVMCHPELYGFNICLPKPYTLKHMEDTITHVLTPIEGQNPNFDIQTVRAEKTGTK